MSSPASPASSAQGVAWDLRDLYQSVDDPAIDRDLSDALTRAKAFEAKYRGKIASLQPEHATELLNSLRELESINEVADKPVIFAMLLHSARTDDPKHGALLSRTRERRTEINQHVIFFDLEWVQLTDSVAESLQSNPALTPYRHFLEQKRVWKPYYLSEPEEKILDEKAITGKAAFARLFEETNASTRFIFEHAGQRQELSQQQILAKLYDSDRSARQAAATGISAGLKGQSRILTFIFNTILQDHHSDGRLRKYPGFMFSRNLSNEITDHVVEALLSTVEQSFSLVQRYYRLKAKLLKLDRLYDYDRYAPIFSDQPTCDWATARRIVQESYTAFSPKAGSIIQEFFDKHWIDAELRPSKRGGAFASGGVPSTHPYILMNFTDRVRDVMTLAHELGHGLHQYLARKQGYFQSDTPLTTAETASVFGEMLTFRRLQEIYTEPRQRLAMLCGKIEDSFATVFRQVVMTRFEQSLHQARQDRGELSTEQIDTLWMTANKSMFGETLELTEGYAGWWSYIGHFIRSPFYCYAYSFGELLVLALYQKYQQEGEAFVPKYLELLASGGSDAPHVLLERLGVDVTDPSFWSLGIRLLTDFVTQAEQLANE